MPTKTLDAKTFDTLYAAQRLGYKVTDMSDENEARFDVSGANGEKVNPQALDDLMMAAQRHSEENGIPWQKSVDMMTQRADQPRTYREALDLAEKKAQAEYQAKLAEQARAQQAAATAPPQQPTGPTWGQVIANSAKAIPIRTAQALAAVPAYPAQFMGDTFSGWVNNAYDYYSDLENRVAPQVTDGKVLGGANPGKALFEAAVRNAPQLGVNAAIAMSPLGVPGAVIAGSGMEFQDARQAGTQAGLSDAQAFNRAAVYAPVAGALEAVVPSSMAKGAKAAGLAGKETAKTIAAAPGKYVAKEVGKGMVGEGATEAIQQTAQDAIVRQTLDPRGAIDAGLVGAVTGGGVQGLQGARNVQVASRMPEGIVGGDVPPANAGDAPATPPGPTITPDPRAVDSTAPTFTPDPDSGFKWQDDNGWMTDAQIRAELGRAWKGRTAPEVVEAGVQEAIRNRDAAMGVVDAKVVSQESAAEPNQAGQAPQTEQVPAQAPVQDQGAAPVPADQTQVVQTPEQTQVQIEQPGQIAQPEVPQTELPAPEVPPQDAAISPPAPPETGLGAPLAPPALGDTAQPEQSVVAPAVDIPAAQLDQPVTGQMAGAPDDPAAISTPVEQTPDQQNTVKIVGFADGFKRWLKGQVLMSKPTAEDKLEWLREFGRPSDDTGRNIRYEYKLSDGRTVSAETALKITNPTLYNKLKERYKDLKSKSARLAVFKGFDAETQQRIIDEIDVAEIAERTIKSGGKDYHKEISKYLSEDSHILADIWNRTDAPEIVNQIPNQVADIFNAYRYGHDTRDGALEAYNKANRVLGQRLVYFKDGKYIATFGYNDRAKALEKAGWIRTERGHTPDQTIVAPAGAQESAGTAVAIESVGDSMNTSPIEQNTEAVIESQQEEVVPPPYGILDVEPTDRVGAAFTFATNQGIGKSIALKLASQFKGDLGDIDGIDRFHQAVMSAVGPKQSGRKKLEKIRQENDLLREWRQRVKDSGVAMPKHNTPEDFGFIDNRWPVGYFKKNATIPWDSWLQQAQNMGLITDPQADMAEFGKLLMGSAKDKSTRVDDMVEGMARDEVVRMKRGGDGVINETEIPHDSFVWKDGEWHKATQSLDGGVTLQDGETTVVKPEADIRAGGVIGPDHPAWAQVSDEYAKQESGRAGVVQPSTGAQTPEGKIIDFLSTSAEPQHVEVIAAKARMPVIQVEKMLASMKSNGQVKQHRGNKFSAAKQAQSPNDDIFASASMKSDSLNESDKTRNADGQDGLFASAVPINREPTRIKYTQLLIEKSESSRRISAMKKWFGLTTDVREAGYITPDGKMLDLSGKKDGGGAGVRHVDHRDLPDDIDMLDAKNAGAVRVDFNYGLVNLTQPLTPSQKSAIISGFMKSRPEYIVVEVDDPSTHNSVYSADMSGSNIQALKRALNETDSVVSGVTSGERVSFASASYPTLDTQRAAIEDVLRRAGFKNLKVEISDDIGVMSEQEAAKYGPNSGVQAGMRKNADYSPANETMRFYRGATKLDAFHEIVHHAMLKPGLLTKAELLAVHTKYGTRNERGGLAGGLNHEEIARAGEEWLANRDKKPQGIIPRTFQKVYDFVRELALRTGFAETQVDDVFRRVLSGQMGRRDGARGSQKFGDVSYAGMPENAPAKFKEVAAKEWREKGVESRFFKKWFGDSKVVDADGKPLVVYHGAKRSDRIGSRFLKSRATSGPMPFFTDNTDVASGYAQSKKDTSLDQPDDYSGWFKYRPNGEKRDVDLDSAWFYMAPDERRAIAEKLPHVVNYDENGNEIDQYRLDSVDYGLSGEDYWNYEIRRAKGNVIKAAKEIWLNGGNLIGRESEFIDILEAAGIRGFRVDDPNREASGVFPVYMRVSNPLDTSQIPEHVVSTLEKESVGKRAKSNYGADPWDKRTRSGKIWITELKADIENGTSHAWTSIPDWVTKTLDRMGYDGIKDVGGKMGGYNHAVWIPFSPTQIKSAIGNAGTFNPNNPDILASRRNDPDQADFGTLFEGPKKPQDVAGQRDMFDATFDEPVAVPNKGKQAQGVADQGDLFASARKNDDPNQDELFINVDGQEHPLYNALKDYIEQEDADEYPGSNAHKAAVEALRNADRRISNSRRARHRARGSRELFSGILQTLGENGYISFRGIKVNDHFDVAELFHVYRNEKYETVRYIYTGDDGNILAHEAITSKLPGATNLTVKNASLYDTFDQIEERMGRLGATRLWVLHNHPSGVVTPSSQDLIMSGQFSGSLGPKGYVGHIIIDHDKFTYIDKQNNVVEEKLHSTSGTPDDVLRTDIDVVPSTIASILKDHQVGKNEVGFLFRSNKYLRGMVSIPDRDFSKYHVSLLNRLRNLGKSYGSANIIISVDPSTPAYNVAMKLFNDGRVLSVVDKSGNDLATNAHSSLFDYGSAQGRRVFERDEIFASVALENSPDTPTPERPPTSSRGNTVSNPLESPIARAMFADDELDSTDAVPDEEIRRTAQAIYDDNPDKLERSILGKVRAGTALNPVQMAGAKILLEAKALKAFATGDNKTMRDMHALRMAWDKAGSDAARAFRQRHDPMKLTALERAKEALTEAVYSLNRRTKAELEEIQKLMDAARADEREKLKRKRDRLLERAILENRILRLKLIRAGVDPDLGNIADDPDKAAEALRELSAHNSNFTDAMREYYTAMLLYNPVTHMANMVGNTANMAYELMIRRAMGSLVNAAWYGDAGGPSLEEFSHMARGMVPGMRAGIRRAINAWRREAPEFGDEMGGTARDYSTNSQIGPRVAIAGKTGRVVRLSFRALLASDEFNKALFSHMVVGGYANRLGKSQGLSGDSLGKFIEEQVGTPGSDSWKASIAEAKDVTFQSDLGKGAKAVQTAINDYNLWFLVPFFKTPVNILKRGFRASPFGATRFLTADWRGKSAATKAMDIGEQVFSWGLSAALAGMMLGGDDDEPFITGTSDYSYAQRGAKDIEMRERPPMSIKIGDKWYSYRKIEPVATSLALIVDSLSAFRKAQDDGGAAAKKVLASFAGIIKEKTFMRGLGDIFRVLEDVQAGRGDQARKWAQNFATSWIPFHTGVKAVVRAADDDIRETRIWDKNAWLDQASGRVAYSLGGSIAGTPPEPKVSVWGQPTKAAGTGVAYTDFPYRLLSPELGMSRDTRTGRMAELDRMVLNWNNQNPDDVWSPRAPEPYFERGGKKTYLNDSEYRRLCEMAGERALKVIGNRPLNADNPTEKDKDAVENALKSGRDYARLKIQAEVNRRLKK